MASLFQLFVLLFAAALTVSAASAPNMTSLVDKLPPCSLNCIVEGVTQDGCAISDLACGCSKINELTKTVSPCMAKAGCTLDEMTQAASAVVQLCESAGLITNTTAGDPTSTTGAASAATTKSDAGRFAREFGFAYAAFGVLVAMVVL
ncbi:hypothetical protein M441DRAFT_415421 [Trichoderma asperellum CBS 433.97]|uniref:CFEM domain-containing protein n=1 Tax=Trichoderma asperellum (strain ATCC 204424 / CBS 433.97 / NBRC 101777) TaxID=1042311 RepID=A0A2T3Z852_TRIA4|nr:hypothetical protein M441DRAFT_415421 [Trichoderma asperellum CBS 433.97]PTB40960.1 hypothetical protein M441DRAFT_415421 [Trichoderma asperellum CBS 433.97]